MRLAKERAEDNVKELKDKLREELLKAQHSAHGSNNEVVAAAGIAKSGREQRYQDDSVERAKYEELIGAVMSLELA